MKNEKLNLDPNTKQNIIQGLFVLGAALMIGVFIGMAMCKAIF
tara:strand:+ start:1559 stop:1687 length:129 start_codon:yes stop_codon:yes gene_type:complete